MSESKGKHQRLSLDNCTRAAPAQVKHCRKRMAGFTRAVHHQHTTQELGSACAEVIQLHTAKEAEVWISFTQPTATYLLLFYST